MRVPEGVLRVRPNLIYGEECISRCLRASVSPYQSHKHYVALWHNFRHALKQDTMAMQTASLVCCRRWTLWEARLA